MEFFSHGSAGVSLSKLASSSGILFIEIAKATVHQQQSVL